MVAEDAGGDHTAPLITSTRRRERATEQGWARVPIDESPVRRVLTATASRRKTWRRRIVAVDDVEPYLR